MHKDCQYCHDKININETTCTNCLYDIETYSIPNELLELLTYDQNLNLCCVCLDVLHFYNVLVKCRNCKIEFHFNCLNMWITKSNTCPLCKISNPN